MATYQKLPESGYGSFDWLRREVGGYLGLGYNPDAWDSEQSAKVDSIVNSGLMQFYYPPPIPAGKEGEMVKHRWSFMSPVETMVLVASQSTYELPEDFAGITEEGFTVG